MKHCEDLNDQRQKFLAFIKKRVNDESLAEDLLQDAFLKALKSSSRPESPSKLTSWFYSVVRSVITDNFRRQYAHADNYHIPIDEKPIVDERAITDAVDCVCETFFWSAISPEHADVLKQVSLEGTSLKAYANRLAISYDTARARHSRAKKAMEKAILKLCTCFAKDLKDCPCPTSEFEIL